LERADFCRVVEALQIEHLTAADFLEHEANVIAIRRLHMLQPLQAIWQAAEEPLLGCVILQRHKRCSKVDKDLARSAALNPIREHL
jgi:hypothetical protein